MTLTTQVPGAVSAASTTRVGQTPEPPAPVATSSAASSPGGRFYAFAELVMYIGLLNVLVIVGTLAGGIVLGWAPALAAAVACSRARLHGDEKRVMRRFFRTWRREFRRSNLMQLPATIAAIFFVIDWMLLSADAWAVVFLIAAGLCVVYHVVVVTMDAHYELTTREALIKAGRFMLAAPGAPLLLAATLALVVVGSVLLPGLIPVLSLGTAVHLCTALCLSFYAANDRNVA